MTILFGDTDISVKAYKFRIDPDKNQQAALIFTLNTCWHLYDAALILSGFCLLEQITTHTYGCHSKNCNYCNADGNGYLGLSN